MPSDRSKSSSPSASPQRSPPRGSGTASPEPVTNGAAAESASPAHNESQTHGMPPPASKDDSKPVLERAITFQIDGKDIDEDTRDGLINNAKNPEYTEWRSDLPMSGSSAGGQSQGGGGAGDGGESRKRKADNEERASGKQLERCAEQVMGAQRVVQSFLLTPTQSSKEESNTFRK
ncbi:hypothetical protein BS50DRAFT_271617 [Corynespora cassiicola Philippines]|uniref:Uncharacterized protein n=1 Tax=Corynespora cassiicola Philippines TaxID=1448308 RepID=A0A2T2P019_CORCC|nr:hypothetical protein BS50DRAFT_271617 [Corynespora cassiicola Philippines]